MKKVYFFCLLITMVSCKQTNENKNEKTKENVIWDAFLEYANNNIDDPSSCEFVSIDSLEMLSTIDTKRELTEIYDIYRSMSNMDDSLSSVLLNNYLNPNSIKLKKLRINKDKEFVGLFRKYHKKVKESKNFSEQSLYYALMDDTIHSYCIELEYDGIMQSKDTTFYSQVLSYRTTDNTGKHLNKIYVISDTLYNVSTFSKNKEAYPNEYTELLVNALYFTAKYKTVFDMENEKVETMRAMIYILETRYGIKVDNKDN